MVTIEKILLNYDPEIKNLLPALREISADFGYVSEENARKAAGYLRVPLAKIFETASFYDLISTKKEPFLVIKVCSGTNCAVSNSFSIIKEIENYFKIKAGDDYNPKVKLEMISCLGRCGEGPVVIINGKIYTQVNTSSIHRILEEWV